MTAPTEILTRLMTLIEERRANPPEHSYTTKLFEGGVERIGDKIVEEAGELVDAARQVRDDEGRDHLVHEAADLVYHLFVMLGYLGVSLDEVADELAGRFGTSGLDEKASRLPNGEK